MTKLRVLDLFSGIGGFSLGLERAKHKGQINGFETVAFCEIEEFPRRVLAKHWPDVPCYTDVRELTAERLAADGIAVDVICGGFPCQDLSIAGKQAGLAEGTRSGLWSEILRLTRDLRPKFILVENVANLLSGPSEKRGRWFGRVLGDLASIGYDAEWENIPAAAVGAPHARERVWIVAYPDQRGCAQPILNAKHVAQRGWFKTEKRRQNWQRNKVGSQSSAISGRWLDQPNPAGMAYGVSDWPHRIAALGNAVVPQIPELIGNAILEAINS